MTAHWGVEDLAAIDGTEEDERRAFRKAAAALRRRRDLRQPARGQLDRTALQRKVAEIGAG